MVGKFLRREFALLQERIELIHNNFETAIGRLEKPRDQYSRASGQLTKQTGSLINIEERAGTSKETTITERHVGQTDTRKIPAPWSTSSFSMLASGAAERYLESEDWAMEDPGDWAIILTEMRNNVQNRAASLLGHVPYVHRDHRVPIISPNSKQPGPKGVYPSTQSNLTLELRRLEIRLLMQIASFTPPDLCPPHEYFQAVKLTPSYPIVLSGYSWEAAIRHVTDLFNAIDVSSMETGSAEAASTLFDLSQTLEDLCMHHYSYTVATWALVLRRGLYISDKDMHRRDLASAFCLKARVLGRLGRTNGAMTAASGAVQLCYEDQALQGVQLSKALHVQAPLLDAIGRRSEAKVVAREMVSILGALGDDKPHLKHFLSLAQASLSNLLLDTEEYDEALAVIQDAIKSVRALIGVVDSRPTLSIALLIKARILAARREKGSAYVAAVQAVRHLRDLRAERPVFTTFLAHALVLSSRYLQTAGFQCEARKNAEEAVELHRALHTSAPLAFAPHYAEAVGQLLQLRMADGGDDGSGSGSSAAAAAAEGELFDMAQHAAGLFREASIRDSEALASVLLVIASELSSAGRAQEATAPAEEAVLILRARWKRNNSSNNNAAEYAPRLVHALWLAAACRGATEAGLEYAKEAVEVHRSRRDVERAAHEEMLTRLLMDVFTRLRALGREVEAIRWKTEAARLNVNVVEIIDPPPEAASGTNFPKDLPGGLMGYGPDSDDEGEDI
ncbi:hypothetical protein BJV74DRAFT_811557 [Russula compacta]|nr:hypothetical protein BJV74DRAFT_811557 [Russula compacta]